MTTSSAQMRVARALWAAARPVPDPVTVHGEVGVLDPSVDGPRLAAAAAAHRMSGLLWRALAEAGSTEVLGPAAPGAEALAAALRAQAVIVVPQALRLAVEPLHAAGLEPVVLKGPAVAARYPAPGLRPMDDIDLLLPRAQHQQALRALEAGGWHVRRAGARDRYDTVLQHPAAPSLPLELHYGLQAFYERASRIDAPALWRRRRSLQIGAVVAHAPSPEDELLMLAAHAAKPFHTYLRLIWAADLAVVLGAGVAPTEVDWDVLSERATRWRCRTAVFVGLVLACRLGATVPASTVERFRPARPRWQQRILGELTDVSWPVAPPPASTFHLRFALADTTWRRLALLAGAPYQMGWTERLTWPVVAGYRAVRRYRALGPPDTRER